MPSVSKQAELGQAALDDQQSPSNLLRCAGILILVAQPVWLAMHGQLSLAVLRGIRPLHVNVLTCFSLFNVLLGVTLLSTVRFAWLACR
jgi:hypothetical protein